MAKITVNNLTTEYPKIKGELPEILGKEKYDNLVAKFLPAYGKSEKIKSLVDLFVDKLNEFVGNGAKTGKSKFRAKSKEHGKTKKQENKKTDKAKFRGKSKEHATVKKEVKSWNSLKKEKDEQKKTATPKTTTKRVDKISVALALVKRYVRFDGKEVTKTQVLNLHKAIKKAATERTIRKIDPYAAEIEAISRDLAETYNEMGSSVAFEVPVHLKSKLEKDAKDYRVRPSTALVKRYVNLIGKETKEKAQRLLTSIENAEKKGSITDRDPNHKQIETAKRKLKGYIDSSSSIKPNAAELNGLKNVEGVGKPDAVANTPSNGNSKGSKPKSHKHPIPVINPLFVPIADNTKGHRKIKKEHLKGGLGKFLGYVERYEYAILLKGDKGAGKTTLMYQIMDLFAGHGYNVGCFSLEIGKESNLVSDNRDKYIKKDNLPRVQIAEKCPNGLADIERSAKQFDVVCIDSWSKIPDAKSADLDKLRKKHPETMFVCIFQSTVAGTARGGSAAEFDAGMVIHVHEGGEAVCEKNRYNEGNDYEYLVWQQKLKPEKQEEKKTA